MKKILILILGIFFSMLGVFAVGFHQASEILAGQFSSGDFSFDGNVGIGTTNPSEKLSIHDGSIKITQTTFPAEINLETTGGYGSINLKNSVATQTLLISSQGNSYFNGGNVGIGTTNPASKLQITNTGSGEGFRLNQDGVSAVGDPSFYVYSNAVQVNAPLAQIFQDSASSTQPVLLIKNHGSGYGLIVENGNVGIGTTNPQRELEVLGELRINTQSGTLCDDANDYGTIKYVTDHFYGCTTRGWKQMELN